MIRRAMKAAAETCPNRRLQRVLVSKGQRKPSLVSVSFIFASTHNVLVPQRFSTVTQSECIESLTLRRNIDRESCTLRLSIVPNYWQPYFASSVSRAGLLLVRTSGRLVLPYKHSGLTGNNLHLQKVPNFLPISARWLLGVVLDGLVPSRFFTHS